MTQRKSKKIPQPNSTINSTAPTSPVESVKAESKAKVASKPKQANNKAPAKPRGRPKKVVDKSTEVEINLPAPVSKAVDVGSRTITYASAGNAVPSKYEQLKAWLVFKLYYYTSYFRGY